MLDRAKEIIKDISERTDSIILMHSLSGKDSIALLDLCAPQFRRIVCVYMYLVPNLAHIERYHRYAVGRYGNAEWVQVPHYGLYSYIKSGYMGCERNPQQKQYKLSDIIDKVRQRVGIEWACLGFKQTDSLNRLLMLRSYKDGKESICWAGKKFYPLATYNNSDVLRYIETQHLISPENYGGGGQSCGCDISDPHYLLYLQAHYLSDLERIYRQFPQTRFIIPKYERETKQSKQAGQAERSN